VQRILFVGIFGYMEKKLTYVVAQFESILIQEIKESFFLEAFFRLKPQDVIFFQERTL